jgi:nucleoside-diphosphate-sugar epimerase
MILITGGGGFLGLNIARSLANCRQNVLLVQRRAIPPHPILLPYWDKQVKQAAGNVLDRPFILGLVHQYPIESIIHGAFDTMAIKKPETLKERLHQVVEVELDGIKNLLEAARIAGLRHLTFISSVDCYRGWPDECEFWREDAYLPPVSFSPIGNCKRAAEQLGFLYSKTYGFGFAALRVGRVYGPGASSTHGIKMMVEGAIAGKSVNLVNISASARAHTVYAKDVGEATRLVHLAESLEHNIYNVSDGGNPTMYEIAQVIQGLIPTARITLGPEERIKPAYTSVDVTRMQKEFGYVFRGLKAGIGDYVAWLESGNY